jgi:1-acyl-sn-glycerol-3-phosphate acyltransferase
MIFSGALSLYYAGRILLRAMWGKCPRASVDAWMQSWARKIIHAVRLHYTVCNPSQVNFNQPRNYIIMSNHSSHYDIPIIVLSVPGSVRMLTKQELLRIPIWGLSLTRAEFVYIDRHNREQAIRDLDNAKEKLISGIRLWIAPEGTRSRTGTMQTFKKGGFMLAIQTGAIIVPVGIRGANRVLPAKTWQFHLNQRVEVTIGEPVDASQYTIDDRNKLMQVVEHRIREASGQLDRES